MLRESLDIIKLGFKKRFITYYVVVLSLMFFGTFPHLIVKLVALGVFFVSSVMFLPIFTSQLISGIQLMLAHRTSVKLPVSKEITELAETMGTSIDGLVIVKGCTAYVWRKTIALGKELLELLTFEERQAVVAHELGHVKGRHVIFKIILLIPALAVMSLSWTRLSFPIFFSESLTQMILTIMLEIALLAFSTVVLIPINWFIELKADKVAAVFVGKKHIKSALAKLGKRKSSIEPSETHPSIADRLKAIDKLKIKQSTS